MFYNVKAQRFSATQILREIKFGNPRVSKTAIFTILAALKFQILGFLHFQMCEFLKSQNSGPQKWPQVQFLSA